MRSILWIGPITALTRRAGTIHYSLDYFTHMKRRQFLKAAVIAGAASSFLNVNSFAQAIRSGR